MPKDLLSDAKIRTAKPAANRYKLGDGGGLFLSVEKTGGKLWRWKFRLDGKENLFAIGSYPEVSLAEARAARDAARELVKQGINPSQHRKDERQRNIKAAAARKHAEALAQELSFAKVSAAYLAKVKPDYTPGSYRSKESRIRKYLSPKLDTLPITEIGPKEIRPILEACEDHGAWAGIHVKGDLSAIFQYAVIRGLVDSNPIPGLRGLLKIPVSKSKAVLTADQIRAFYRALRAYRGYPETLWAIQLHCRVGPCR